MSDLSFLLVAIAIFLCVLVLGGVIADALESPEARDARERNDP